MSTKRAMKYLSQQEAIAIDQELFKTWSVDQLMELAGLSCAVGVTRAYPKAKRVLCVCGPGNNGGDGIVAARHLKHFGYSPAILYPKPSTKPLFRNLVAQADALEIPFVDAKDLNVDRLTSEFDILLDGIFGFSFKGASIRSPFDSIVDLMRTSGLPICSIDVPSGWDVEKGNVHRIGVEPETLISLTAPKLCASHFRGKNHFLGGRFVPPKFAKKHGLSLPPYGGVDQVVRL